MKKILGAVLLLGMCGVAKANPIVDQFQVALFGHVETITETTTRGATYLELLGTPIQIGRMDGDYLVGIDGGVLGDIAPAPGQGGFNWTYGVHLHLTPFLKKYVFTNISPEYPAIAGIEINPRVSIDRVNGHNVGTYGLSVGYAFALTPIQ